MKLRYLFLTILTLLIESCSSNQNGFSAQNSSSKASELEEAQAGNDFDGDSRATRIDVDEKPGHQPSDMEESETLHETIDIVYSSIPTEIFLLVDTSSSMVEEKDAVATNIQSLIQQLTSNGTELDYHLYIIQENAPESMAAHPNVTLESKFYVGSHDALKNYTELFWTDAQPGRSTVIKPDPNKHHEIIVVTDENSGWTPDEFTQRVAEKGVTDYSLNAIVGLEKGAVKGEEIGVERFQNNCNVYDVGQTYIDAAAATPTPGLILDICNPDWTQLLAELGQKIKATITTRVYSIPSFPTVDDYSTKVILDDDSEVPPDAYSIDKAKHTIEFGSLEVLGVADSFTVYFTWEK